MYSEAELRGFFPLMIGLLLSYISLTDRDINAVAEVDGLAFMAVCFTVHTVLLLLRCNDCY